MTTITKETLNSTDIPTNDNSFTTCSRTFSLVNPVYSTIREYVFELCDKGIGAVESNEQIRKKYGEQAPTLCTIYKWRREYRGGKVFFIFFNFKLI
jgi:hypothetical protein